ncbi:MAG: 50S ribosomal protein L11 methyltransferase [Lachnospiraceae bacterium]|jgi:ribosomal protein L11 methyltransferase|nr:50S ribosomal protein L11 methyltransferase [Lachnospiraceae bacterium]MCH4029109.1 50S ribosomal protein L11 methyltransferase [Lachnospiraceae bacterium]MCH4066965.1 50S ribosomal protein L11 methyltransferase [Lachnospiraceae bacterium]MCH4112990.1 50S ribosomal protein L11 methyltransferase [Lachnospiraceae bacterium]MCI1352469.1 50S ribosomal protein L11 methyltransferase [Lachnospiraceae bacterium]
MKWMRFRVRTTVDAEDIIISKLEDIGLEGAQIEDNVPLTAAEKEQMFVDICPPPGPDDGTAVLSFYVEENEDGTLKMPDGSKGKPEKIRKGIAQCLDELRSYSDIIGDGTISVDETKDEDWINNWKQYFHQFWIDDILCIPSWEKPEKGDGEKKPSLVFHIDPGTAFGTGMHETTQLCIREIRKYLTDETNLLDIGTGSGILGILSLMLGGRSVTATDLDPCAVPAVNDNLKANGVDPSRFHMILGNLTDDKKIQDEVGYGKYDIVVANILPSVLVPLTPAAVRCMKPGAVCIMSGIIDGYEKTVADACEKAGLEIVNIADQGEWHSVTGRKAEV